MSHVGHRYDLVLDDKALRVVVVGQESGWPKNPRFAQRVSLADRYQQVHGVSGLARHYYTDPGYPGRNPHMRGTTSALRIIFGLGLGTDHEAEFVNPVNGKPFHLFDGFALVNRLLCSSSSPESSKGRPTRTMWQNCGTHFRATMKILEPTLVVVQGHSVAKAVNRDLPVSRQLGDHLYESDTDLGRILVATFSHPSAHGSLRWGDNPKAIYLTEVVEPTLTTAVSLL
ncbi:hypothetical protein [Nocardioides taihuensis]|uniref:Uracil-DNA glycosylase-like domain-containing protein n=1 Tax=Nocardioides taihuensis TaxID=1835606 RepID=A0ABW0BPT9_9ACTN